MTKYLRTDNMVLAMLCECLTTRKYSLGTCIFIDYDNESLEMMQQN